MRLLAIDPGFTRMGWAMWPGVLDGGIPDSGVIEGPNRDDFDSYSAYVNEGIEYFYSTWEENFSLWKWDCVVGERLTPVAASTQRVLALIAVSIVKVVAIRHEVEYVEIGATTVKKFVTGNGKATKAQVRRAMVKKYPHILTSKLGDIPFDARDALAIGDTYLHGRKGNQASQDS